MLSNFRIIALRSRPRFACAKNYFFIQLFPNGTACTPITYTDSFSQHLGCASLSFANHMKGCLLASKFTTCFNSFRDFQNDFASVKRICFGKKCNI